MSEYSPQTSITFAKEGTLITINDDNGGKISIDEWDTLIDSFEPASFKDIPYKFFKYWAI